MAKQTHTFEEELQVVKQVRLDYLSDGYLNKRWSMILSLHGADERGSVSIWRRLSLSRSIAIVPPLFLVDGGDRNAQCFVRRDRRDYTTRIYLTGLSMGEFGTWMLGVSAALRSDRVHLRRSL